MAFKCVTYEKKDKIAYITLNRPEKRNAMNMELMYELKEVWTDFSKDDNAIVAIVTGNGPAFSAGADIAAAHKGEKLDLPVGMPGLVVEVTKPIIGAINGPAMGMGLVLAMLCDIRLAADTAWFSYPEARVGASGLMGADLTRYMPVGIAMEVFFTCQPLSAQRAYEVGFVNKITPAAELMPEATKMARLISTMAPMVLKSLKIMGYRDNYSVHRQGTAIRLQMVQAMQESEDAKEGFRSFVEKREPDFKGR